MNKYLQPEDIMAVWSTFGGVMFTNDKATLNKKIEEFLGTTDLMSPVAKTGDPGGLNVGLGSAMDWFSGVQGRKKAVLLFSAGWGGIAPVFSEGAIPSAVHHTPARSLRRADLRAGYARSELTARAERAGGRQCGGRGWHGDVKCPGLLHRPVQHEVAGGRQRRLRHHQFNEYDQGFRRIVDENSTYYVLGYQSTQRIGPNWDYRELSVKLADPKLKGARVQVRKGYIARR